jgi:hypothetical protein
MHLLQKHGERLSHINSINFLLTRAGADVSNPPKIIIQPYAGASDDFSQETDFNIIIHIYQTGGR